MTSRVQIARAPARVALAALTGEDLPDSVRSTATMDFADANDAVMVARDRDLDGRFGSSRAGASRSRA